MAHADYDCCLICDRKMSFSYDARTKEEVCVDCLKAMRERGEILLSPEEVIELLKNKDDESMLKWLNEVGYVACHYFTCSSADRYIIEERGFDTDKRFGEWYKKEAPSSFVKTTEDK